MTTVRPPHLQVVPDPPVADPLAGVDSAVVQAIKDEVMGHVAHYLTDLEWRYKQARELLDSAGIGALESGRQVHAEDIDDLRHRLTGYTLSNNTNAAGAAATGSIRWQALHIVYAGVDYTIADAASLLKYHTFVKPASGTTASLVSSDTKPSLGPDDILVFVNEGGIGRVAASDGAASLTRDIADGAVDTTALAQFAVTGDRIANNGIGTGKLGTGAINLSTMFGSKVVAQAAIGDTAVGSGQLASGAVIPGKLNILSHVLY